METPASSWSIKAGRKAAKVGAGAQPCLIRSQVKLCGSWPVTPCTIVHNAISISSTPKINQTLNSFKCFCGKTLPFSFQWQIYLKGRPFLSPSGDLGIGLVWHNLSLDHPTHFLVPLLKSSSNWTKFSMRGPQLFSGWYQMILGVFRCSQLFSDVFSWVVTFIESLCNA